jgi:hypothetical protein
LPLNFNIKFYRFECYEYITSQTDHGRPDPFDPPGNDGARHKDVRIVAGHLESILEIQDDAAIRRSSILL